MTIKEFAKLAQYAKKCGINTFGELQEYKNANGLKSNGELYSYLLCDYILAV